MTTPTADAPAPKLSAQAQVIKMLTDRLEEAKQGKIAAVVIGYTTPQGGTAVQSSPIDPVMLNHISTMLTRRVARAYDRVEQSPNKGTGAGPVPTTPAHQKIVPKGNSNASRNQRRAIARAVNKAAGKSSKVSPGNGAAAADPKPS